MTGGFCKKEEKMKNLYISSNANDEIVENLRKRDYRPVLLPPSKLLDTPVASHADMLLHRLDDKLLVCEYYYNENKELFDDENVILTDEKHGKNYPDDIIFNAFVYKNTLVGKIEKLSKYIRKHCESLKCVNVKQGYAKCSCIVTPDFCITADKNIFNKLYNLGCSCVSEGGVELDGYNYGFLGGASFYDDGKMFFFGDLYAHKDGKIIAELLKSRGIETNCLTSGTLKDLGGAIVSA